MNDAPFVEQRVTVHDGLRLRVREYPGPDDGGTPVLCLAGFARTLLDFEELAERLSASRRVVTLDYRGRGASGRARSWRNYGHGEVLSDLRNVVAATRLERFIVIGTSYGGLLTMGLGAAMPTALAGVVLNDIGPDLPDGGQSRILSYIGTPPAPVDMDEAVAALKALVPNAPCHDEADWHRFADRTFEPGLRGRLAPRWDPLIARCVRADSNDRPDMWNLYRTLRRLPLGIIRGEKSDMLTADTMTRMLEEHGRAEHATIAGVGHAPDLSEAPAAALIDSVLARADEREAQKR